MKIPALPCKQGFQNRFRDVLFSLDVRYHMSLLRSLTHPSFKDLNGCWVAVLDSMGNAKGKNNPLNFALEISMPMDVTHYLKNKNGLLCATIKF